MCERNILSPYLSVNKFWKNTLMWCWIIVHLQLIHSWFIKLLHCQNILDLWGLQFAFLRCANRRMLITFMSACQYILPWVLPITLTQHQASLATGWHTAHILEYPSWVPGVQINHIHSHHKWGWTVMYVVENWCVNEITPKGHAIRWESIANIFLCCSDGSQITE